MKTEEQREQDLKMYVQKVRAFLERHGKDPKFMTDKTIASYGRSLHSIYEAGMAIIEKYY